MRLAKGRIFRQAGNRLGPFLRRIGQEAGLAVDDHFPMNAHRIGHDRQSGGHVLQDLQTAFALAPQVVAEPTDADVRGGQFGGLGGRRPRAKFRPQAR